MNQEVINIELEKSRFKLEASQVALDIRKIIANT